jgi:hypothetical protein
MKPEDIYKKIETVYASEKGRGFIIHLLRSFFPLTKSYYMWEPVKGARCCITGIALLSKDEAFAAFNSTAAEENKFIIKKVLGEIDDNEESPFKKALNGKILGIKSDSSEKFLCREALVELWNFYTTNMHRDNHLKWVAKDERKKQYEKNNPVNIHLVQKPCTTNLGDLLKEKLNKNKTDNGKD